MPEVERITMKVEEMNFVESDPRKIPPQNRARLKSSLDEFGLVQEIVVNRVTNNIVGGAQRVRILKSEGVTEVPVALVTIEEPDREQALRIALNSPLLAGQFTVDIVDCLKGLEQTQGKVVQDLALDKLVEGLADREKYPRLQPIDKTRPPTMTWVLIGIPTVKFPEIAKRVSELESREDVVVETTVKD